MSVIYTRQRIRLAIDAATRDEVVDELTGEGPTIWRGSDLAIEVALFFGVELITPANYTSVTAEIRDYDTRTQLVGSAKVVASGALNATLTLTQWEARTHQHASFAWTAAETVFDMQTERTKQFWLLFHALTTDSPARKVLLGGTTLTVVDGGTI